MTTRVRPPLRKVSPSWVRSAHHRALVRALVEARETSGMNQRDLALKLGKPRSFVGKVESVERGLSALEMLAWCRAVGVKPEDIVGAVNAVPGEIEI